MRYSALIRKLLDASEEARYQKRDIADRLKERCVDGADVIRQTLMNAVCDPRFKMHVNVIPKWRQKAQIFLEQLAEKLSTLTPLNKENAFYEMDNMLDTWLHDAISEAELIDMESLKFTLIPKNPPEKSYRRIKKALEEFVEGMSEKEQSDDHENELIWEEIQTENETKTETESEEELKDDLEIGNVKIDNKFSERKDVEEILAIKNPLEKPPLEYRMRQVETENRFLKNVPPSLIRLAKLIGRSGDGIMETSGSFASASKNDIGGITTGNDLNSLLPSELAMLSESSTQNLFYKNYVTHRLQTFASMSQENKGKKHREGPIIICMDGSSSMAGEPVMVAKALTLAICIIAQRKKRPVLVVKYSFSHDLFRLHNIGKEGKDLLEFLTYQEMGGNDENALFKWLFEELLPNEDEYDSADVLCISDFGWTPIDQETMEIITREKAKSVKFYGLNVENHNDSNPSFQPNIQIVGPKDVCDSLWEYSNGVCKEVYTE